MMNMQKALLLTLCACNGVFAQPEGSQAREALEEADEIIVIGERRTTLRLEMMEAEKFAYEMFNQFNDERRFDISCGVQARTGSRFVRQVCQPEFEITASAGHARDFYDSMPGPGRPPPGSIAPTHSPMEMEIARQQAAFKLKMRQVAEEHPEFLDAIKRYAELQERYRERTGQTQE